MKRPTKSRVLLGIILAATMALAPAIGFGQEAEGQEGATAAEPSGIERFNGRWRYSGSASSGTAIIERSIETAVDPVNFIIRSIVAGKLREKNALVRSIQIEGSDSRIRVVFDGSRTYEGAPGQWVNANTSGGDPIRYQLRYHGGSIVHLFRGESGTRRNVYRLRSNGQMRMEVSIRSDRLPNGMNYRLTYRH